MPSFFKRPLDETGVSFSEIYPKLLELSIVQSDCPIHEDCDASCDGQPSLHEPLKQYYWIHEMSGFKPRTQPKLLAPDTVCHDEAWLAAQNFESFQYTSIESTKARIRLLIIKPANFKKDVLECEIIDACLDDVTSYAALSYCWGAPYFDHKIVCNGKMMAVTSNLHDALKRYREDYEGHKESLLWVDALCINQADLIERNEQVRLMHRIYSQAVNVNVDLGHVDRSWLPGFVLLSKLDMAHEIETEKAKAGLGPPLTGEQLFEEYDFPRQEDLVWQLYIRVLASPWFSRAWVVQEIVVARNATIRFGPFSFRWQKINTSLETIKQLGVSPLIFIMRDPSLDSTMSVSLMNATKLRRLRHEYHNGRQPLSLLEAMTRTRDFHASDPRDKIIAVLGLAYARPNMKEKTDETLFQADYTLSTESVYCNFAAHLAQYGYAAQIIDLAGMEGRAPELKELPSWVPDWAPRREENNFIRFGRTENVSYHATADSVSYMELSSRSDRNHQRVLGMEGDQIDIIAQVTPSFDPDRNRSEHKSRTRVLLEWHLGARALVSSGITKNQLHPDYIDIDDAFARTIIANDLLDANFGDSDPSRPSPITNPKESYRLAIPSSVDDVIPMGQRSLLMDSDEDVRRSAVSTFYFQAIAACGCRRFAITQRGYMGLVPSLTQPGDTIALILGSSVPFVLRPNPPTRHVQGKETTKLIGDAYIHGIMDGEGMDFDSFAPQMIYMN
ncbi:uncharacterized protein KY384_001673 [Bacidia gigantensis]|uniref:uncharacterized protein n=1 Tax=Bacidia gigantensis TaxID=2732470 RepID=UPI001D038B19|nr:uncharacterized protein KY384_001673 [Bacidia gigantensis]KAG8533932.1 hypothetical protein KY384_001673 [Bacidia gigantensis]